MLQNHAWLKDPFIAQARPVDFNVRWYKKFIDNAFRSHIAANLCETTTCPALMSD